ncbi:MAG: DUF561 domain-containing protein [Candidatus Gastranaerophilales bacterium]|nr:DUF561 domain-containing protein [Candidatus Gastranaerophilales bacterium]
MNRIEQFKQDLKDKKAVKIIAGIDNFDAEKVKQVVTAASKAGASAVDIACDEALIAMAKEISDIAVFVSSTSPKMLQMAKENGADALELGNFDALYKKGLRIGAQEVFEMAKETRELAGYDIFFSVTVPGHINIEEQIKLVKKLEALNVDLIQTEGASVNNIFKNDTRNLSEKITLTVFNTVEIKKNTTIPVMTASGITPATASVPFEAGADAIGAGSCINKLNSVAEMVDTILKINEKAGLSKFAKELV